jgi:hypothetical protein
MKNKKCPLEIIFGKIFLYFASFWTWKQPDPSLSLQLTGLNLTQFLAMYEAPASAGQLYVHPAPRVG